MRRWFTRRRRKTVSTLPFTAKTVARTLYWYRLLQRVQGLNGAIVECGTGAGDSLVMLAAVLRALHSRQTLIGFDSFEGLPAPTIEDGAAQAITPAGFLAYSQTHLERLLRERLGGEGHGVRLVPGWFAETLHDLPSRVALAHLDCDLYESYRTCLEVLGPKMVAGGIIAVDEYTPEATRWPGAKRAIDDWCTARGLTMERDPYEAKYFVVLP